MRTPLILASLFRLPKHAPHKVTRLRPHGDGIRYEITILRWAELLGGGGAAVGAGGDVLLAFDLDADCEDCRDERDWDGEGDLDEDDAGEGEGAQGLLGLLATDGLRREREADVWRTRLGGGGER